MPHVCAPDDSFLPLVTRMLGASLARLSGTNLLQRSEILRQS
jgi:hypothetical protein